MQRTSHVRSRFAFFTQRESRLCTSSSTSKNDCRRVLFATVLFAIALALPSLLLAQAYFGTVSGSLTDASGAVVQGATVVLTDQQKGFFLSL